MAIQVIKMDIWSLFITLCKRKETFTQKELKVNLFVDDDNIPVLSGSITKYDDDDNIIEDFRTMFRFIDNRWMEFPKGEKRINLEDVSAYEQFIKESEENIKKLAEDLGEFVEKVERGLDDA